MCLGICAHLNGRRTSRLVLVLELRGRIRAVYRRCKVNNIDLAGFSQFLSTMGEFTRGTTQPFIPPVWDGHLLTAAVAPLRPPQSTGDLKETLSRKKKKEKRDKKER
ncbi:hypothetical protein Sjap_008212 [Stephania japonica]|uniref:Uncharacterized protein n=1 Tax=Stephania japonica TaxID=461633 RepID=A0AAP0PAM5_9MAGN